MRKKLRSKGFGNPTFSRRSTNLAAPPFLFEFSAILGVFLALKSD
jgi:hypothetical protein